MFITNLSRYLLHKSELFQQFRKDNFVKKMGHGLDRTIPAVKNIGPRRETKKNQEVSSLTANSCQLIKELFFPCFSISHIWVMC